MPFDGTNASTESKQQVVDRLLKVFKEDPKISLDSPLLLATGPYAMLINEIIGGAEGIRMMQAFGCFPSSDREFNDRLAGYAEYFARTYD